MDIKECYYLLLATSGSIKKVARRCGVSRNTVRNTMLLGMQGRNTHRIYLVSLEVLKENMEEKQMEQQERREKAELLRQRADAMLAEA
jgi:hypothetical protein